MSQNDVDGNFDTPVQTPLNTPFQTPLNTPFQTPRRATSDYSDQVDKHIDLETQDRINMENRKQEKPCRNAQEAAQRLSGLQPNIPENQETRELTSSLLNLVYKDVSENEKEKVIVKDEVEK